MQQQQKKKKNQGLLQSPAKAKEACPPSYPLLCCFTGEPLAHAVSIACLPAIQQREVQAGLRWDTMTICQSSGSTTEEAEGSTSLRQIVWCVREPLDFQQ